MFDAQAGDEIYFNILGNTNGSTAWRIINAHGQQILAGNSYEDSQSAKLLSDGKYYLIFDSQKY